MSTLKTIAQEAINRAAGLDNTILSSTTLPPPTSITATPVDTRQFVANDSSNNRTNGPNQQTSVINHTREQNLHQLFKLDRLDTLTGTNEAHIPPLLGVAPLGPCPMQKEHQLQFQMMEAAEYHLPQPSDSERLRGYLQRQPVQTPNHYPQVSRIHRQLFQSMTATKRASFHLSVSTTAFRHRRIFPASLDRDLVSILSAAVTRTL